MWVMAIRSGMNWRFDPGPDDVVSEHDVLLVRGPEEGVNLVRELAGAAPLAQVRRATTLPRSPSSTGRSTSWWR